MKSLIAALLLPLSIATIHAQSPLPPTVIVGGGGPVDSKEFTVWIEKDPTEYSGSYSGDIGGDTGGSLTVNVAKREGDSTIPFVSSGEYTQKTAGAIPQVVKYANAHYYHDSKGVFSAGAFQMIFVQYKNRPGVLINGCYIPKKP